MSDKAGIAHLGMYERPETAGAHDRFWRAIRAHLGHGPAALTRDVGFWTAWQHPDLLLSQTCGMPFRTHLHDKVTLVGSPDYGLTGCPPGYYNSVFVARREDQDKALGHLAEARFAYNEPLSQSGWAAPATHAAALGITFTNLVRSGGHRASARAVAEGRADLAALDALSWDLVRKYDGFSGDLAVIDQTAPTPTLPYITAKGRDPEPLFSAISAAIGDLSEADRDLLHLRGLVRIDAADYLAIPTPAGPVGG